MVKPFRALRDRSEWCIGNVEFSKANFQAFWDFTQDPPASCIGENQEVATPKFTAYDVTHLAGFGTLAVCFRFQSICGKHSPAGVFEFSDPAKVNA